MSDYYCGRDSTTQSPPPGEADGVDFRLSAVQAFTAPSLSTDKVTGSGIPH